MFKYSCSFFFFLAMHNEELDFLDWILKSPGVYFVWNYSGISELAACDRWSSKALQSEKAGPSIFS